MPYASVRAVAVRLLDSDRAKLLFDAGKPTASSAVTLSTHNTLTLGAKLVALAAVGDPQPNPEDVL